jgi:hypothetical protein
VFFSSGCFTKYELCRALFTLRGQERSRRTGLGRSRISSIASRSADMSRRGGKSRLARYLAADDPEGADEGHPVGVQIGLVGGFPQ